MLGDRREFFHERGSRDDTAGSQWRLDQSRWMQAVYAVLEHNQRGGGVGMKDRHIWVHASDYWAHL
jgi:hypothetical protein